MDGGFWGDVVWSQTPVQTGFSILRRTEGRVVDLRLFGYIPRPTDEAPVLVDAVSAEWKAATVDRLYRRI